MVYNLVQRSVIVALSGIMLSAVSAWSETKSASLQARVFGYGAFQFGQIVKGQYAFAPGGRLLHFATEQALVQVGGEVKRNDGVSIVLVGQGRLSFPYALPTDGAGAGGFACYSARYTWDIHHAEVMYAMGNPDAPTLSIGAGLFPFKYNPDSRTFGDFLLRISPHPQFLQTSFDAPYAQLLGIRFGSTLFSSLRQDVLLTSEIHLWPLRDFSLSYLVSYNLMQFADIGAGIMGDRLFPVDDSLDKPTASVNPNRFTFGGTKVMFRVAFDFKRFLPVNERWGKNDLRLYSEACLNGLKNYPITDTANILYPGYNKLGKRMPVLFGFNVPTFGLLDILSIEGEWWDNNFANSYWGVFNVGYAMPPNPYKYPTASRSADPYGGPWHWSVLAKKTIVKNIKLTGWVGRDHTFIETSHSGLSNNDPQEAMDGKGNWAWMAKVEYGF